MNRIKKSLFFFVITTVLHVNMAYSCDAPEAPQSDINNVWYCYNDSDTVFVFVHGILSDSRSAWKNENGAYWPDLVLNDKRYGDPSVYLGGFYTAVDSGGSYDMRAAANELYSKISILDANGIPSLLKKKNIVFITHSTGGIVVRHMLTHHEDKFQEIKVGLVLIASPSLGSKDADRLKMILDWANNRMGQELKWDNAFLRELDKDFKNLVSNKTIPYLTGIEILESQFIVKWGWFFDREEVVTAESGGRYFGEPIVVGNKNHFSVVKPSSMEASMNTYLANYYLTKYIPAPSYEAPAPEVTQRGAVQNEIDSGKVIIKSGNGSVSGGVINGPVMITNN